MKETQLTARGILMVVLFAIIFMAGMFAMVFIVAPSSVDPASSRNAVITSGIIGVLSAIWFVRLAIAAVRDRRRGIVNAPVKSSGRFNVWFGAAVAVCGIVCSALTYDAAGSTSDGMWTLYWGMIAWGIVQSILGCLRVRNDRVFMFESVSRIHRLK